MQIFDAATHQDAVFDAVGKPLVEHVLQGYNACAFAYGQTGAGKTHSMFGGDADARGLIPRACELLLRAAEQVNSKGGATSLRVFVSFLDIYLEQVCDAGAMHACMRWCSRHLPACLLTLGCTPAQYFLHAHGLFLTHTMIRWMRVWCGAC